MKLYILVFIYLFVSIKISAQEDTFSKHSYFIYGNNKDGSIQQATAFLIKKHHKTYLVSAKHVLTGYDPLLEKPDSNYPDTL